MLGLAFVLTRSGSAIDSFTQLFWALRPDGRRTPSPGRLRPPPPQHGRRGAAAVRPFRRRGRRYPAAGRVVAPRGAAESGSVVPGRGNRPEGAPAAPRQPRAERGASRSRGAFLGRAALSVGTEGHEENPSTSSSRAAEEPRPGCRLPPRGRPRYRPSSARAEPLPWPGGGCARGVRSTCPAADMRVPGGWCARAPRGAASFSRPEPSERAVCERRAGPGLPVSRAVPRGDREAAVRLGFISASVELRSCENAVKRAPCRWPPCGLAL